MQVCACLSNWSSHSLHFMCTTSVFIFETSRLDKNVVKQANAKVEDAISVNGVCMSTAPLCL